MMKKFWLGILVIVLVFGIMVVGCDNSPNSPQTITYRGFDLGGNEYTLTLNVNSSRSVSNGDEFAMETKTIEGDIGTSNGTVVGIFDDTFTLEPSIGTDFNVTVRDGIISSIVGNVTLSDGTVFIVRTFNEINMWVGRWRNGGYFGEDGDNYASGDSIKLKDIFEGNLNDLFSPDKHKEVTFRLTGTIDKKLKVHLRFFYNLPDGTTEYWLGGGTHDLNGGMVESAEIGTGNFSVEIPVKMEKYDISTFPPGEVHLYLEHIVYWYSASHPEMNIGDTPIPENIPNGTIMATIRNLKVEPVSIVILP